MNLKLQKIYERIVKLPYKPREINTIDDNIGRKDTTYNLLSRRFYYRPKEMKLQLMIIAKALEKQNHDANCLSKASYIYGLNYKWGKALENMEKVIILEEGKNIDSWIDYGLFLRKSPIYQDISIKLLLNIKQAIFKYRHQKDIINFLKQNID